MLSIKNYHSGFHHCLRKIIPSIPRKYNSSQDGLILLILGLITLLDLEKKSCAHIVHMSYSDKRCIRILQGFFYIYILDLHRWMSSSSLDVNFVTCQQRLVNLHRISIFWKYGGRYWYLHWAKYLHRFVCMYDLSM